MGVWGRRGVPFPTEFKWIDEMSEHRVGTDGADVRVVCGGSWAGLARGDVNEKKRDGRSVRVQGGGP